jgi:hypothetical protein
LIDLKNEGSYDKDRLVKKSWEVIK